MYSTDAECLLNFAIENGMLDLNEVQGIKRMKEREEILSNHKYKISTCTDGRWQTYLPDRQKGRKLLRKSDRKQLEDAIYQYYIENVMIRVDDVFREWIDEKMHYAEITESSYNRYLGDYKRFFKDHYIFDKPFKQITEYDIEKFLKDKIVEHHLTQKSYSTLRLLVRGIWRYGKSKNYTELKIVRFFDELYLSKGIFERKKKIVDEDEVFSESEQKTLIEYFREHPTPKHLGLLLQFQTGMRIGEISALKPEDVSTNSIYVRRTEEKMYDKETGKSYVGVVDTTKTSAGERHVLLPDVAKETIKAILLINQDSEYLFSVGDKRISTRMFRFALEQACKKVGIKYKSTHKIRKTYASTLIANDVNENIVKQMLGHSNILTTHSIYNFSTMENGDKIKELNRAINL